MEIRPLDANALNTNDIPAYYGSSVREEDVQKWVDEAPTLDYAPVRHGEWEYSLGSYSMPRCSCCGWSMPYSEDSQLDARNYFPNCGAKMDAKEVSSP